MLNFKSLLLLSLISFSLQSDHCLLTFELCREDQTPVVDNLPKPTIENCLSQYENKCYYCKEGFLVSSSGEKCISFPNCRYLVEGNDEKCERCEYFYQPNSAGKCERSLCEDYKGTICSSCYDGYYLKGQECKKITLDHCIKWDEQNCLECAFYATLKDGRCTVRSNLIKGCEEYDSNGKCDHCDDDYSPNSSGGCDFDQCNSGTKVEYCGICEVGYYPDENDGLCTKYDGTRDDARGNKIEYSLLISLLALLI